MTRVRLVQLFLFRLLPVLVISLLGARAMAQADPPARVGRLNHAEGPVVFSPAGDNEWTDAAVNRPLTRGDRLWTDKRSRAEIQVGSSAVRLDGQTHLEIVALDDQSAQLSLTQGTVYLRVRSLPEGENFEIDTPNLAYRAVYPGDYRIDVDAASGTTRVTIHSGTGAVYGEGGQVLPLGGGQQVTFRTRALAQVAAQESPPQDNFDRWANERNRREDQSVAARYVPREVVGYQQLDAHGQWAQDATHGTVWFPQNMAANWAPYRSGHWEWIAPWGWNWIDNAAWGFAPFHYGRWAVIGSRWAWVPGRIGLKPVYAPALVAFVAGGNGSNWIASGRPGVAWFPLAPGEAWLPAYAASPVYMANLNRSLTLQPNAPYAHQRNADALTAISAEDFHRGKPARAGWLRVAANTLTNAQVIAPPPMPERSAGTRLAPAPAARVVPPAQAQARQEVADATAARQVQATQRQAPAAAVAVAVAASPAQATAQAQRVQQPRPDTKIAREPQVAREPQAKTAPQPRVVDSANAVIASAKPVAPPQANADDQAKMADQARRAEKSRRETIAKAAEQAKAEEYARRFELAKREQVVNREQVGRRTEQSRREQAIKQAEAARREQVARREQAESAKRELLVKREQARRESLAKRAEQAKAEKLARRADQAKREALAKRDEQQRREAHALQVEQARRSADRDAQVLAEQRARREELQAKRDAQEREQSQTRDRERREEAQREASARQQQALAEQWRRDRQVWEQQQQRVRQRPELRDDRRSRSTTDPRGIQILNAGPMS